MCVYCFMGDHVFRFDPPWDIQKELSPSPYVPAPTNPFRPIVPWEIERLKEYRYLLKEIADLEAKTGCPCEPNKADYLKMFKERIEKLEQGLTE